MSTETGLLREFLTKWRDIFRSSECDGGDKDWRIAMQVERCITELAALNAPPAGAPLNAQNLGSYLVMAGINFKDADCEKLFRIICERSAAPVKDAPSPAPNLAEAAIELLNDIEDVVDDANFEAISVKLWNKVSGLAHSECEAASGAKDAPSPAPLCTCTGQAEDAYCNVHGAHVEEAVFLREALDALHRDEGGKSVVTVLLMKRIEALAASAPKDALREALERHRYCEWKCACGWGLGKPMGQHGYANWIEHFVAALEASRGGQ